MVHKFEIIRFWLHEVISKHNPCHLDVTLQNAMLYCIQLNLFYYNFIVCDIEVSWWMQHLLPNMYSRGKCLDELYTTENLKDRSGSVSFIETDNHLVVFYYSINLNYKVFTRLHLHYFVTNETKNLCQMKILNPDA